MSDSFIKFRVFVNYWADSDSVRIKLCAEDTVEDLKLELYNKFYIKPSKQLLEGWVNIPNDDRSHLKHCCLLNTENILILMEDSTGNTKNLLNIVISYDEEETLFRLNGEDTVEIVKLGVCEKFKIPFNNVVLEGWKTLPFADNTFLQECCHIGRITFLTVKQMDKQLKNKDHEEKNEDFVHLELEAGKSFSRKIINSLKKSVKFHTCFLKEAIESVCLGPLKERKILLLFFYNSQDIFSKIFLEVLQREDVCEIIKRSYYLIGWDVGEMKYIDVLVKALNNFMELSCLADIVERKTAAAVCIDSVEGNLLITTCLRGKVSKIDILNSLKNVETFLNTEIKEETELNEISKELSHKYEINSDTFQQMMADRLGDRDYDCFEDNQHDALRDKIGFALKGPPQSEKGYEENDPVINKLLDIIKIESNLISQFKDVVEISFIYNCTEPLPAEKLEKVKKQPEGYNPKTDITPLPIFVLHKCKDSENPCRVFIDDTGRVYYSWNDYIKTNTLPKCVMILPQNGKYQVNEKGHVLLDCHLSPACLIGESIIKGMDITATVGGIVSGGIFVAAAIPAIVVAPAALVVGGVVGASVGLYSISRSIFTLVDRKRHKQSLAFGNSEARGAYINIVCGSLGFFGAGANVAVSQLAARGFNIAQGARTTVTVLGVVNIAASGVGILNSGYDMYDQWYNENQTPSLLTMVQLGSSILFFGNAVYSFKTGTLIVEEAQQRSMQDFQESLRSNRHRKIFNKLYKSTLAEQGDTVKARAAVISAVRNIQNKDEVFAVLTRTNKSLNKNGIKFTADNGEIKLNGVSVDMGKYAAMVKSEVDVFLGNLAEGTVKSDSVKYSNPPLSSASFNSRTDFLVSNISLLNELCQKFIPLVNTDTKQKIIIAVETLLTVIEPKIKSYLFDLFPKNQGVIQVFVVIAKYFGTVASNYYEKYKKWNETKEVCYYEPIFEIINMSMVCTPVIIFDRVVQLAFTSNEHLKKCILDEILDYFYNWLTKQIVDKKWTEERDEHRQFNSTEIKYCKICNGYNFSKK